MVAVSKMLGNAMLGAGASEWECAMGGVMKWAGWCGATRDPGDGRAGIAVCVRWGVRGAVRCGCASAGMAANSK